jgi:hypothetical protein
MCQGADWKSSETCEGTLRAAGCETWPESVRCDCLTHLPVGLPSTMRFVSIYANECPSKIQLNNPTLEEAVENLQDIAIIRALDCIAPSSSIFNMSNSPVLKTLELQLLPTTSQLIVYSPTLTTFDLETDYEGAVPLAPWLDNMPMLETLNMKLLQDANVTSFQPMSNSTIYPKIRRLQLAVDDCHSIVTLPWNIFPALSRLDIRCFDANTPVVRLSTALVPQGQLLTHFTYGSDNLRYIDIDAIFDTISFFRIINVTTRDGQPPISIFSNSGLIFCHSRSQARDYQLVCRCGLDQLVNASHCPPLGEFVCPGTDHHIRSYQVCDGQRDCLDGYDEQYCLGIIIATRDDVQGTCVSNMTIQIKRGVARTLYRPEPAKDCYTFHGVLRHWHALEGNLGTYTLRYGRPRARCLLHFG